MGGQEEWEGRRSGGARGLEGHEKWKGIKEGGQEEWEGMSGANKSKQKYDIHL